MPVSYLCGRIEMQRREWAAAQQRTSELASTFTLHHNCNVFENRVRNLNSADSMSRHMHIPGQCTCRLQSQQNETEKRKIKN